MTQDASFVYQSMISKETPVNVQNRVFNYAAKNKDVELLIKLSQLTNLDAEIDEKLSKRQEAEVLAAWASRQGRTTDALIERFASEKRATLLTQLAQRTDLPEALYLQIAKHESASVGEAILKNSSAPEAARITAAKHALRSVRASWSTHQRVTDLFRGAPAQAALVGLEHAPSLQHLCGLLGTIDRSNHNAVVDKTIELLITKSTELDYTTRTNMDTVWSTLGADQRTRLISGINEAVSADKLSFNGGGHFLKDLISRPVIDPIERALEIIVSSVDETEIRIALNETVNKGNYTQRREALHRAVLNINCPVDAITSQVGFMDRDDLGTLAERVIDNDDIILDLLKISASNVAPVVVKAGKDLRNYVEKVAAGSETPVWARFLVSHINDTSFAISVLGAKDVLTDYSLAPAARKLMLDRLGEDNSRWELLERLIVEWSGTLPDLLNSVDNL